MVKPKMDPAEPTMDPAPLDFETVGYEPYVPDGDPMEMAERFRAIMARRRTIRDFSDAPVDRALIESIVRTATSAPSGANKQPWRFVCVQNPDVKRQIREAAEQEEREFYARRASEQWLDDLKPFGTDWNKPFLEIAPWLIVIFELNKSDDGTPVYYSTRSVGLAAGMLLAAAHQAGLATLTHTPAPMKFLRKVLGRPDHERPFLLIPIGWPADGVRVPKHALERKPLDEVMVVC